MNEAIAVYLMGVCVVAVIRVLRYIGPGFNPAEHAIDSILWPFVFVIGGVSAVCGPDGDG